MDGALYLSRSLSEDVANENQRISRTPSLNSIRERINSSTSWSTHDDEEKTEDRRSKGMLVHKLVQ